jgi:hypothetical protein
MLRSVLSAALLCGAFAAASAQTLAIPEPMAKTYANGTRGMNGKPGKNFWMNHGKYDIAITVNPPHSTVKGVEHITYYNDSPDKLDSLNMKLIINSHRGRNAPEPGTGPSPTDGLQVDNITVNGVKTTWDNAKVSETNYMMPLAKPLMPHQSLTMDITWHYLMVQGRGRESIIDPTTFYIAYFYPRVSVYDDYKGWDTQPFGGGLEFYNDLNDYTLSVTVPKDFVVWSTGTHLNPDEVLKPEIAARLKKSFTSDTTIHVATAQDLTNKVVTAQNATNTWKFKASNISDMALAVSDHYDWDAGSVIVDDKTKRRTSMQAAFPDASEDFHQSVKFGIFSLGWFSHNLPGVPYPFEKSTAVQGFADMEFPMMMNDSHQNNLPFAQMVQDHEQAHTYMPFYMSTNESYYAWMDEGWATTFEYFIGIAEKGKAGADSTYKAFRVKNYTKGPHTNEVPVITPSPMAPSARSANGYLKPSLSYLALKDLLGDNLFKKALLTYMDNWHGKHPIPWDYFNSMKAGSGQNLDWFFYNWFYTASYIDISLENAEKAGSTYKLSIKNIGGFAVPFDVKITYADGSTDSQHQTPRVWEKDAKQTTVTVKAAKEVKSITLDGGLFMDADEKNNTWTAK